MGKAEGKLDKKKSRETKTREEATIKRKEESAGKIQRAK